MATTLYRPVARYEVQRAGSNEHMEYWIPAEELEEFNGHIVGQIRAIASFYAGSEP